MPAGVHTNILEKGGEAPVIEGRQEPDTEQPDHFLAAEQSSTEEATGTLTVEHEQGGIAGVDFAPDNNPDTTKE